MCWAPRVRGRILRSPRWSSSQEVSRVHHPPSNACRMHAGSRGPGHKGRKSKLPGLPPSTSNASPSSFVFSQRGLVLLLIPFYWGHILHFCNTSPSPQHPRLKWTHLQLLLQPPLSNWRLGSLPRLKGSIPLKMYRRTHLVAKTFLLSHRKNVQIPNEGRWPTGKPPWSPVIQMPFARTPISSKRQEPTILIHTLGIGLKGIWMTYLTSSEDSHKVPAY